MSGRHSFSELTKGFSPERRRRIDETKKEVLAEMPLHELRRARTLTQQELGADCRDPWEIRSWRALLRWNAPNS